MDNTRQLRTTWIEYLEGFNPSGAPKPDEFKANLTLAVNRLTEDSLRQVANHVSADRYKDIEAAMFKVRDAVLQDDRAGIHASARHYESLHHQWSTLLDRRRQLDRATTWDHLKFFVWRTLQAMMIAVIVLATAIVAKELELPLPFFRLSS